MEKLLWQFLTGGFLLGVIALLGWFLQRFVRKNDERHDATEKKMEAHGKKMGTHIDDMKGTANQMEKNSNNMHSKALEFQQTVNNNLITFKDQVIEINNEMNRIDAKADKVNGSFSRLETQSENMLNTMEAHQKSLSLGAKAIAHVRERMDGFDKEMKSVKIKLGKDTVMIKTRKEDG